MPPGRVNLVVALRAEEEPIDLVGAGPRAVLRFAITDPEGASIPGRLTFLGAGGPEAELFPIVDAAPHELAVRKNVVYTLAGEALITSSMSGGPLRSIAPCCAAR